MKTSFLRPISARIAAAVTLLFVALTQVHAEDYYLRGVGVGDIFDNTPVAALSNAPPFLPFLSNYNSNGDRNPGLTIQKGGNNISESDPAKYQAWYLPDGAIDIDGVVSMTVWLAMKDFDSTGKRGHVNFHLAEYNPNTGEFTSIKQTQINTTSWSGGWDRFDLDFNSVRHTIADGNALAVKMFVRSGSDDDVMVAYGSTGQSSMLSVPQTLLVRSFSAVASFASADSTPPPPDEVNMQVAKTANRNRAPVGSPIIYTLQYNLASTISSGTNVRITDVLDPNLAVTGLTNSTHIANSNYDAASNTVVFTFVDPLPAGASGEVRITAEFQPGVTDDYVAPNTARMTASNGADAESNTVNVTADVPEADPLGFTKGVYLSKWANSSDLDLPHEVVDYQIKHGNTGGIGQGLDNYEVTDTFPSGLKLRGLRVGNFPGTTGNVDIYYQTLTDSDWRLFGTRSTASGSAYTHHTDFGVGAGDYVTALRFDFGTIPGGGGFHPDSPGVDPIRLYLDVVDASLFTPGSTVTNCATLTAQDAGGGDAYDETSCTDIGVAAPAADFLLYDNDPNGAGPYEVGDIVRINSTTGQDTNGGIDMVNPTIMNLLPVGFSYRGNETLTGSGYVEAGEPVYSIEVVPDFAGTSRELVRLTFPSGFTIPHSPGRKAIEYRFDMEVLPSVSFGTVSSEIWVTCESPGDGDGFSWRVEDSLDVDGDGDTTERMGFDREDWEVGNAGSGVASLDSVMGVKGELDSDFSRFPDSGLTVPSGQADYKLDITNSGGVALKDLALIEILPHVGDRGVIDLSERDSEWAPFLAGAVDAPDGMQVFYSTSGNPCREELTPGLPSGCEDPAWASSLPSDPTTVKSLKFEQIDGSWLRPGESVEISWPMRAPINAPTNSEIAWSSFGVVATRADNNQRLLPSEPMKVGIGIQPPQPPFFGDTVWLDANRDGIQDAGEVGINGVRVELYEDDGDGVADPAVDTMYGFTVTSSDGSDDGKYRFSYIPPGDYFAVFYAPDDHSTSPVNAGSNDVDSDGVPQIFGGQEVTVTTVTEISALEIDLTWDQGFYDRGGLPAVWAIAEYGGGSIVIGGKFQFSHGVPCGNIAVLSANGTPSAGFSSGTGFDGVVRSIAVSSEGKILVGGEFTSYDGHPAMGLALLDGDGSFVNGIAMPDSNDVRWVGSAGGNFYVAGAFSSLGGNNAPNIGRLDGNGQYDSSFQPGAGADGPVHTASVVGGGLIIGGSFSTYKGEPAKSIARVLSDGSPDMMFDPGDGFDGLVNSVTVKGGMIFAVGEFSTCDSHPANGAARLSMNGAVDTSYEGAPSLSVTSNRASN